MPPVIVAIAAMAAAYGVTTAAIALGWVVAGGIGAGMIFMGTAMAVSMIGNSLIGQDAPDLSYTASEYAKGLLLNKAGNTEPIPVIYGSRRVGGARVFMEASGASNEYSHLVFTLCEGPISAINTVYLNNVASTDAKFSGFVDVYKHLGADDQTADTDLIAACPASWTADHRLRGVAYLYIRLKYNRDVFSGGLPTITADVDGRTVYDTRDSNTKFTHNPALCARDYLTNARYGRGIPTTMVDDTAIGVAANYCEEHVTVGGVTQDRYTCDGVVNIDDNALSNAGKLLTSCRGMLIFSGGLYKLVIDKPETPTAFAFTEDNITGSWTISLGTKKNIFNRLRAKFYNPDKTWAEDIAPVDSPALRALDNGLILEKQIELPFTADINTAKQITTINLNQSRQQIACSFTAFISGLRCEIGDVVPITHSTPGWTAKPFRILNMSLKNNDEVIITAREYADAVYDFGTIAISDTAPNTNLPDLTTALPPTGLQVAEDLYYTATGKGVQAMAILAWITPADAFVSSYDVEYKLSAGGDWTDAGFTKSCGMLIYDLAAGLYDFRVRAVNMILVASTWTTTLNKQIAGLTTVPADITSLTLRPLEGQAHLQWTRATDKDVLHGGFVKIRYVNLLSGAVWEAGVDIGPSLPGTATNAVLPLSPGTYMAKAVDSSGNISVNAAMVVTSVPSILAMNYVVSQDEAAAGFLGSKTNMTVVAGMLELDAGHPTGSYVFAAVIDLGGIYSARVWPNFGFSIYQFSDLIDSRTSVIDSWPNVDGAPSETTTATIYIRTTNDNPAGSPIWSSWMPFMIADYKARAFDFKVEVETGDLSYGVSISALEATIDMADRTERGSNVTVPAAGKSVVFVKPFNATPAIGVTANNMATGDYYTITSSSRTGFTVRCYNSSGVGVERNIDWIAVGYGGEG